MLAVFNNEEVGSNTRQGADSTFLTDVLERIAHGCGLDSEAWKAAVANSFMVSADNAHAIHPAHPEYADKGEFPVLGGGIVIKYNANQRYTTDAVSGAVFQAICQEAGVPVQRYSNRRISPAAPPWAISPQPISPFLPWTSACPNWPCTASARRRGRRIRTIW